MTDDEILGVLAEAIQAERASKGIAVPIEEIVAQLVEDDGPELSEAEVSAAYRRLMASIR